MTSDRDKAARELLAFYLEAGVDALLDETPVDRFTEAMAPAPSSPPPERGRSTAQRSGGGHAESQRAGPPPGSFRSPTSPLQGEAKRPALVVPPSPDVAVIAAHDAARSATNLDELRALLDRFEACALRATATQLVFADGNPQARVMFVGE